MPSSRDPRIKTSTPDKPRLLPAFKALVAQLVGCATVLALGADGKLAAWSALELAGLQAVVAVAGAIILRSAPWWWLLHLLFVPAIVLASQGSLPSWLWLLGLLTLLLLYGAVFRTQVPLFLSNARTVTTLARWLPENPTAQVLDIGSGTGSLVCCLARLRPHWRITGIELAWLPWWMSRWRCRKRGHVELQRGDFWHHDLGHYDVVYAFLSPVPMPRLWDKARREMKPGALLISNSFAIPDVTPQQELVVDDFRHTRLYCYCIGAAAS